MKKYLLLVLFLTGFSSWSFGQSLVLSNYNLTVSDPGNTNMLESTARLDNNGTSTVDIVVERDVINLPAGMYELFCFGAFCNPPGTTMTSYTTPIVAGGRETTFDAKVMPNGNCGTATIHYRFYDQNDPADSTGFTLNFAFCTQGLNDVAENYGVSKPLKNPADQFTVFTYNLPSNNNNDKLYIYNMLGSLVKTLDVTGKNGSLVLNTADLKSGLYIASYVSENKVKNSYKLVVSHR
ncbi:MAG: T9SS type A sorting domain-containing protein [Bacteroidota bacterium]